MNELEIAYEKEYERYNQLIELTKRLIEYYENDELGKDKISEVDYHTLLRVISIAQKYSMIRSTDDESTIVDKNIFNTLIEKLRESNIYFNLKKKKEYSTLLDELDKSVPHIILSKNEKNLILHLPLRELSSVLKYQRMPSSKCIKKLSSKQLSAIRKVLNMASYKKKVDTDFEKLKSSNLKKLASDFIICLNRLRKLDRIMKNLSSNPNEDSILDEVLSGKVINPDSIVDGPGLFEDYRQNNWYIDRICLDCIQNHLPGDSKGTKVFLHFMIDGKWYGPLEAKKLYESGKQITKVRFADNGVGFTTQNLLFLHSTKTSEKESAGQFGEGMKLAALAGLRQGLGMEFQSRNWSAFPVWKDEEFINTRDGDKKEAHKSLAYKINEYEDSSITGSRTIFHTPTEAFIQYALNLPEKVLELDDTYEPVFEHDGDSIVSVNNGGKLYVKKIFIQTYNTMFSYNFTDIEINPDRNRITTYDSTLRNRIYELLYKIDDVAVAKRILSVVVSDKENKYVESGFADYINYNSKEVPKIWKQAFIEMFSSKHVLASTGKAKLPILHEDRFEVPEKVASMLDDYNVIYLPSSWIRMLNSSGVLTDKNVLPDYIEEDITTPLTDKYVSIWGEQRIMIDAVQNHLPGDSGGYNIFIRFQTSDGLWHDYSELKNYDDKDIIKIKICDDGRGYDYHILSWLSSENKDNQESVGQFGEGLKMICGAALTRNIQVELQSRDWKAVPFFRDISLNEGFDNQDSFRQLCFHITSVINENDDKILDQDDSIYINGYKRKVSSSTTFSNLTPEILKIFRELDKYVLTLNKEKPEVTVNGNSIISYNGKVYIKDLFIKQFNDLLYSYNFTNINLENRDRNNVAEEEIKKRISEILSGTTDVNFISRFIQDSVVKDGLLALRNYFCKEFFVPIDLKDERIQDLWVKTFYTLFPKDTIITSITKIKPTIQQELSYAKLNIVKFSDNVYEALKNAKTLEGEKIRTLETTLEIAKNEIINIPEEEYTPYEKFIIETLKKYYNEIVGLNNNIDIQLFTYPDEYNGTKLNGRGENNCVFINRDVVNSDLLEVVNVFFHNVTHARTHANDESHTFRDFLTYLLGKQALKMIKIDKVIFDKMKQEGVLNDEEINAISSIIEENQDNEAKHI